MSQRWGPLTPAKWPQASLDVPSAAARYMPPVQLENREVAGAEAFTMSGSILIPAGTVAGQVFELFLATDQDGDFWCDQIYLTSWPTTGGGLPNELPVPSIVQISDARTGKRLCYPEGISTEFLATVVVYQDKPAPDYSLSPLPNGFRSTSTLPQAFPFTRQGGIQVSLMVFNAYPANTFTIDVGFGGWKEYAFASS